MVSVTFYLANSTVVFTEGVDGVRTIHVSSLFTAPAIIAIYFDDGHKQTFYGVPASVTVT